MTYTVTPCTPPHSRLTATSRQLQGRRCSTVGLTVAKDPHECTLYYIYMPWLHGRSSWTTLVLHRPLALGIKPHLIDPSQTKITSFTDLAVLPPNPPFPGLSSMRITVVTSVFHGDASFGRGSSSNALGSLVGVFQKPVCRPGQTASDGSDPGYRWW